MTMYIVERTLPGISRDELAVVQHAVIEMSEKFTAQSRPVKYIRTIFIPSESYCLSLFEATNASIVRDLNESAQIPFTRILEAIDLIP